MLNKFTKLFLIFLILGQTGFAKANAEKKSNSLMDSFKSGLDTEEPHPEQAQLSVSGTVTDGETGETLPGVTVLEEGTTNGAITDLDGKYRIQVSSAEATLVFSFVGFETVSIEVGNQSTINVGLSTDVAQLEEVVVVGFDTQSKVTTTGSISGISGKTLEKVSAPNIGEALFGKLPGLQLRQQTGEPGAADPDINIRGVSSFNGSDPFVIIDGVPSTLRDFMQLSGKSIANISILKDASATAVYGVRGANGVIIVTTKRGEAGKMSIEADASFGLMSPTYVLDFVNSFEWATAYNEVLTNDQRTEGFVPQSHIDHYKNQDRPLIFPDNNWFDQYFNNLAKEVLADLRVSGGTKKLRYFVNMNYLKQDGNLVLDNGDSPFGYDRFNLTSNVDLDITPTTQLKFTNRARVGVSKNPIGGSGQEIWRRFYESPPMAPVGFNENGDLINTFDGYTPYARARGIENIIGYGSFRQNTENRLAVNMELIQKMSAFTPVLKGLNFRVKVGYRGGFNHTLQKRETPYSTFQSIYNVDAINSDPNLADSAVVLRKTDNPTPANWNHSYSVGDRYIYWEAGLQYKRKFGLHNVGGLLLYNQNKNYYPPGSWAFSNIPTGFAGLVGRVTYDFKNRYLLEFNVGYNGSENFAEDQRFGFFPSFSGGWVVSNEPFMSALTFINFLKLRASYGKVGADQVGGSARFIYLGDVYDRSVGDPWGYNFGYEIPEFQPGVEESRIGNPNVTWEVATKQNYGIDLNLFNDRFSASVDYFYEYREKILMTRNSVPSYLAIDLPPVNIGIMENRGFEVVLGYNGRIGDLEYNLTTNISKAQNEVVFRDEIPPIEPYQTFTGKPLGSTFGYRSLGYYTQDEVNVINEEREQGIDASDRTYAIPDFAAEVFAGDLKYADLNDDGIINQADREVFGFPRIPQVNGGLGGGLSYKGFDLNFSFQFAAQVTRQLQGIFSHPFYVENDLSLLRTHYEDSWRPEEGQSALWPRLSFVNEDYNTVTSSFWIRDASYIRLRNAEIGYSFNNEVTRKIGLKGLRIYVRGNNLLTFQREELKWVDPEQSLQWGNGYPLIRTVRLGLNVQF